MIKQAPSPIDQIVILEFIEDGDTLETELYYNPRDPFAVSMTFNTLAGQVTWTFGRDLLFGGLLEPTGDGDVHVWPCLDDSGHSVVIIGLCSPDGTNFVQAQARDIKQFADRMVGLVHLGHESDYLDVDGCIAAIFAADAV